MNNGDGLGLTRVQRRMLTVLSDGTPHRIEELRRCLADDLSSLATVHVHICGLRKLLATQNTGVSCTRLMGETTYQLVRLSYPVLPPPPHGAV